jgi:integrase
MSNPVLTDTAAQRVFDEQIAPIASIHATEMRAHLLAQIRSGKKPSTVVRAKTTLSAMFTYADEQGLLHQPHPIRTMVKIPESSVVVQRAVGPEDIPTAVQMTRTLDAIRERRALIADVFEFMSLTGVRWGELRAIRVDWLAEVPLPQLLVNRSHSDRYAEKDPKSWRGTRQIPLSPRALAIMKQHSAGKAPDDYLFTNESGGQLSVGVVRKFPLRFRRHALRALRGLDLIAARNPGERGCRIPRRRSSHRARRVRACPGPTAKTCTSAPNRRRRGRRKRRGSPGSHLARELAPPLIETPRARTAKPPGCRVFFCGDGGI